MEEKTLIIIATLIVIGWVAWEIAKKKFEKEEKKNDKILQENSSNERHKTVRTNKQLGK